MANKEVTEARVKNVMRDIPPEAMKNGPKHRKTLKETFTGMKTLLGQFSDKTEIKKMYHRRKEAHVRNTKKKLTLIIVSIVLFVILSTVLFLFII
ncbi:MAG: hypothetical protein A2017_09300 [Lentisphaerae bacterium GWF2_44_16]|nr:MAG: hypothetical protein A2017_09300 [Lentisphaerae bacterium GWF2_44_16]